MSIFGIRYLRLLYGSSFNTPLPNSIGPSVLHIHQLSHGLLIPPLLTDTSYITLTNTDFSGNLSIHLGTSSDASGDITLNQNGQTLTIYHDGHTYTGIVDTSSNISYYLTSGTHSDASGNYSATISDADGGELIVYSDAFAYTTADTNVTLDSSGCVITFPISDTQASLHGILVSSYLNYIDTSGSEIA